MDIRDWIPDLVDLFEYRVEDIAAGESPRGNRQRLSDLREYLLLSGELDGISRRRFLRTERIYRELKRTGRTSYKSTKNDLKNLTSPFLSRLWATDAKRWLFCRLWGTRSEPRLMFLRIFMSVSKNIDNSRNGIPKTSLISLEKAMQYSILSTNTIDLMVNNLYNLLENQSSRNQLLISLNELEKITKERAQTPIDKEISDALFTDEAVSDEIFNILKDNETLEDDCFAKGILRFKNLVESWPKTSLTEVSYDKPTNDLLESTSDYLLLDLPFGKKEYIWHNLRFQIESISEHSWHIEVNKTDKDCAASLTIHSDLPKPLKLWNQPIGNKILRFVVENNMLLIRQENTASKELMKLCAKAQVTAYLCNANSDYITMRMALAASMLFEGKSIDNIDFSPKSAEVYKTMSPYDFGRMAQRGIEALINVTAPYSETQKRDIIKQAAKVVGAEKAEAALFLKLLETVDRYDPVIDPIVLENTKLPFQGIFTLEKWLFQDTQEFMVGEYKLAFHRYIEDIPRVFLTINNSEPIEVGKIEVIPMQNNTIIMVQDDEAVSLTMSGQ